MFESPLSFSSLTFPPSIHFPFLYFSLYLCIPHGCALSLSLPPSLCLCLPLFTLLPPGAASLSLTLSSGSGQRCLSILWLKPPHRRRTSPGLSAPSINWSAELPCQLTPPILFPLTSTLSGKHRPASAVRADAAESEEAFTNITFQNWMQTKM